MMRRRLITLHGALLPMLIFGLAGCGEGILGPLNDTVFVMRTVDGDSLPATVSDARSVWTIIADTIWFESGSDWRRRVVNRRALTSGDTLRDTETDGFVTMRGGVIILDFECRDDAVCVAPDRLVRDGVFLEMERTRFHAGQRLRFAPI